MSSMRRGEAFCAAKPFSATSLRTRPFIKPLTERVHHGFGSPKRRTRPLWNATLDPPNAEVDWVFVDISTKHVPPSTNPERLEAEVQDDAKSLVRVALRDKSAELSVVLCSDDDIRSMNSKWRGLDESTDVLSFPQEDPDQVILGDIVVSIETARRQATERGHTLKDEIRILLVHGLLHLLGYDHEGAIEGDWLVVRFKGQPHRIPASFLVWVSELTLFLSHFLSMNRWRKWKTAL